MTNDVTLVRLVADEIRFVTAPILSCNAHAMTIGNAQGLTIGEHVIVSSLEAHGRHIAGRVDAIDGEVVRLRVELGDESPGRRFGLRS